MNEIRTSVIGTDVETCTQISIHRTWKIEPDGPNDKPIDIWYNGSWIPAFFSDLKAGDFFLDLNANLEPGRCFLAKKDVRRSLWKGVASFVTEGLEVVQAPSTQETTKPQSLT